MCLGPSGTIAQDSAASADLRGSLPQDVRTRVESRRDSVSVLVPVVVAKGQTLSGLSFRHLGAYTPEIRGILLADNPDLKDPSRIFEGETLLFRRTEDRRQLPAERQVAMASRQAVVTSVTGGGEVVRANGVREILSADMFLSPGDLVVAKSGSMVELIVDNQSILRLRGPTRMSLVAVQSSDSGDSRPHTRVRLITGRIWAKVEKWAGPLVHFEVLLPNAIAGVHGTVFETIVNKDSTSVVRVQEGVVSVKSIRHPESEVFVRADQEVSAQRDGTISRPRPRVTKLGAWEKFNQSRDQGADGTSATTGAVQPSEELSNPNTQRRDQTTSNTNPIEVQNPANGSVMPMTSPRNRLKTFPAHP